MSEPPPYDRAGTWFDRIKGLSLTNALVIVVLMVVAIPAYLAWRILNDENLASIIFSTYEERMLSGTDCGLRTASTSGVAPHYFISRAFAYSGQDRWYIGVQISGKPTDIEAGEYCDILGAVILYARDPKGNPSPVFPNSDTTIFPTTLLPIHPGK